MVSEHSKRGGRSVVSAGGAQEAAETPPRACSSRFEGLFFRESRAFLEIFVLQGIGLLSAGLVGRYDECVPVCGPRGRARNNIGLSDNLYMLHSGRISYVGCSHFRLGCTQIAGGELPREDCSARSGIDVCAIPRESEARLDSRRRMYRRDSVDCY